MAGETRVVKFAEGVDTGAPTTTFLNATQFGTYADDAAYVSSKGSAAADGDVYYNTTNDVIRFYKNGAWTDVTDETTLSTTLGSYVDKSSSESVGGVKTFTSNVIVSDATSSTTKDTGSIVTEGGIGVEENLNVGGNAVITRDLTVSGTTTTVNSTTLDVTDANITVNNGGNQASADDVAGITVEMSDATDAKIIYDKDTTSRFKIGDAASEVEIATISGQQVITNKDIDGGTASNTNRLTVPKDDKANLDGLTRKEGTLVYAQDQNKLYADDGSQLQPIGSGVGSVSIYGLLDGEDGDVSSWTDDGTATVAVNSTTPLADDKDYKVTVTGTTQWVRTPAQSLDPRSQYANQTHSIKAQFKITGTSGAEWLVRALDNSNAAISEDLVLQYTDGNPSSFELMFNVASSVTSVKLEIECNSFTAGDLFYIDDIVFDDDPLSVKAMQVEDTVRFHTGNGYGSTNNKIFRFSNIAIADDNGDYSFSAISSSQTSSNNLFTITDSATDGMEITVNRKGYYFFDFSLSGNASTNVGLSLNSTQLTTAIQSITTADMLVLHTTAGGGFGGAPVWEGRLAVGDVIRVHTDGTAATTYAARCGGVIRGVADADHVVREGADRLSEWQSFTPTFSASFGTVTDINMYWRRVGTDMEIRGTFTPGSTTAAFATFSLPSGHQLASDTVDTGQNEQYGSYLRGNVSTSTAYGRLLMSTTDPDDVYFTFFVNSTDNHLAAAFASSIANSGEIMSIKMSIPIQGWTAGMPELYALPQAERDWWNIYIESDGTTSASKTTGGIVSSSSLVSTQYTVVFDKTFNVPPNVTGNSIAGKVEMQSITTTQFQYSIRSPDNTSYVTTYDANFKVTPAPVDENGQKVFLGNVSPYRKMLVKHITASGVHGGTFTSGSWQTRPITNLESDIFGSISSNQLTLPEGVYDWDVRAMSYDVSGHQLRIQNITDATTEHMGVTGYDWTGSDSGSEGSVSGRITITAAKTFEIQGQCVATKTTNGFGNAQAWGDNVYLVAEITKIK